MTYPTHACIVDTPYALALYLLYCDEEAILKTRFFVGEGMPQNIVSRLKDVKVFANSRSHSYWKMFLFRLACLKYRGMIKNAQVYAQDHLPFSYGLLDNLPYTLIEDAPSFFRIYKNFEHFHPFYQDSIKGRIRNWFVGRIYGKILGTGKSCINRLITSNPDEIDILRGKKCELCDFKQMWNSSSQRKKEIIQQIFDLQTSNSDWGSVIIFTQPFIPDCGLTKEEQIAIYKPTIERYGASEVVIKPHPRDMLDYTSYFPQVKILKTKAPMQLLNVMGLDFKIAVTVCSSAVSCMPEDTQILWLGTDVHEKIRNVYGIIPYKK